LAKRTVNLTQGDKMKDSKKKKNKKKNWRKPRIRERNITEFIFTLGCYKSNYWACGEAPYT